MIPQKVQEVLDRNGLKAIEFEPGSTPTAVTAAQALGVEVGQIAKSILLVDKDRRFFMVVCPGDRKVASGKVKRIIGVKTRMGSAEETRLATGFLPGGVCPFGLDGLAVWVDEHLQAYDTIYPAAGTDASAVPMTYDLLLAICGGRSGDLTADPLNEEE